MLFLLLACAGPSPGDSAADTAPDPDAYLAGTAALATPSAGSCPTITDSGDVTLVSNGKDRTVKVLVPDGGGAGKPVVFAWYPLGGSAQWLINALDLHDYSTSADAVVVVPTSAGSSFEWGFVGDATDDLTLYDDMRTCLYDQLGVDLGRVSSVGFSAGALWTSYLSLYRGDTLSAILTFSGGTDPIIPYQTPASTFPALLNYGGDTDVYSNLVNFTETTTNFANSLVADGHLVLLCNHEGGHSIPPEGRDEMDAWLTVHVYGEPSPYADGDISAFPSYCETYTGE